MSELWAVTGASGFVGKALVADLIRDGVQVRGLSRQTLPQPIQGVIGDIRDDHALCRLVRGSAVVAHLAAYVHRPVRTRQQKSECDSVNVEGTRRLIEAIAENAPQAFLILMSSASVYAWSDRPIDENAPLQPRTRYGISKLAAERLLLDSIRRGVVRGVILRPGLVIGRGAPGNLERLTAMIRHRVFVRFRGREQKKTLVPISRLVRAIRTVADQRIRCDSEIFNVGAAPPVAVDEIGFAIAQMLNVNPLRISLPLWPVRAAAAAIDLFTRFAPIPSMRETVEAYASSMVLSDDKLVSHLGLPEQVAVGEELKDALRRPTDPGDARDGPW